jgi:hypothetical protein
MKEVKKAYAEPARLQKGGRRTVKRSSRSGVLESAKEAHYE